MLVLTGLAVVAVVVVVAAVVVVVARYISRRCDTTQQQLRTPAAAEEAVVPRAPNSNSRSTTASVWRHKPKQVKIFVHFQHSAPF